MRLDALLDVCLLLKRDGTEQDKHENDEILISLDAKILRGEETFPMKIQSTRKVLK